MNNYYVNNCIITGSESNQSIADPTSSTLPDSPNRILIDTNINPSTSLCVEWKSPQSETTTLDDISTEVTPGSHPDEKTALTFGVYDVFFASGNFSKKRLGNTELTRICKLYQSQYDAALKAQQKLDEFDADSSVYKSTVMKNIIDHFRRDHPSSKIWTRKHGGEWIDITSDNDIIVSKLQFKLCRKKGEDCVRLKQKSNNEINGRSKKAKAENSSKSRDELNDSDEKICVDTSQIVGSNDAIIVSLSRIITDLERDRESLKRQVGSLKEENKQLEEKVKALQERISSSTLTSIAHTSISIQCDEKSTNTEFYFCDEIRDEPSMNTDELPVAEEMSDEGKKCCESLKLVQKSGINIPSPVRRLYSAVNTKKTGAESAFAGYKLTPIAGELTMTSMNRITFCMTNFMSFDKTSRVLDIGCGQGKPNLHFALAINPSMSVGIEIVPWRWYQATTNLMKVCDKALDGELPFPNCYFKRGNIRDVSSLDPFTHIYMFSTGFNPKTYRAIARRLTASRTPRYLISYATLRKLETYHYKDLVLLHKEQITMVSQGGRSENKTAYFYEIRRTVHDEKKDTPCDDFFHDAYNYSTLDVGERYQIFMNQRLEFQEKIRGVMTRTKKNFDSYDYFIDYSDKETDASVDTDTVTTEVDDSSDLLSA